MTMDAEKLRRLEEIEADHYGIAAQSARGWDEILWFCSELRAAWKRIEEHEKKES